MRVSVKDLGFAYDGRPVLEGIYLEVEEGEILALVGPNGSGKTTLLRNIAGVLEPSAGAVYLDFKELREFSPRELARYLAAVEQERRVGFDFTVRELVELGRLPHLGRWERLGAEDHETIERAMELTHIQEFAERPISTLSGGERQRVFLAIALAQEPKILLLDEPTAHLDINYQIELMEIIRRRAEAGLTIITALHDLNLAAYYADRTALLHRGRIAALGRPEEVLTARNIKRAFGAEVAVGRNPLTGGLYIAPAPPVRQAKQKQGRLHVVCGGGSGVEVLHELASEYELSVGVLSPLDTDFEVAQRLGAELALEAPFAPISPKAYARNLELLERADGVIVCAVQIGPGNLKNLEALLELPAGKVYLLEPERIGERDYTGGRATALVRELLARGAVSVESLDELKVKLKGRRDAKVEIEG